MKQKKREQKDDTFLQEISVKKVLRLQKQQKSDIKDQVLQKQKEISVTRARQNKFGDVEKDAENKIDTHHVGEKADGILSDNKAVSVRTQPNSDWKHWNLTECLNKEPNLNRCNPHTEKPLLSPNFALFMRESRFDTKMIAQRRRRHSVTHVPGDFP